MKREKFLWALTGDHHAGLLFAKGLKEKTTALRNNSDEAAGTKLAEEVSDFFHRELESHFSEEEAMVQDLEGGLPKEAEAVQAFTRRLLLEHRDLRALVGRSDPNSLASFAEQLTEHIRFEENIYFNILEKWLGGPDKERWLEALRRPRSAASRG